MLSDNYRFSAPKTDKHWQGIDDSLSLKITGKDVSSETICYCAFSSCEFKKKEGLALLAFPSRFMSSHYLLMPGRKKTRNRNSFFFLPHVGSDPQSKAKAFSVIYKSLHEMLPSTPEKVAK